MLLGPMNTTLDELERFRWWSQSRLPLVTAGLLILLGAGYSLSLGPSLRYSGRTTTWADPYGNLYRIRTPSGWVRTFYRPIFLVLDQQQRSSSGKHDPASIYRNYIEWWQARP
jgi:hypothetical protein